MDVKEFYEKLSTIIENCHEIKEKSSIDINFEINKSEYYEFVKDNIRNNVDALLTWLEEDIYKASRDYLMKYEGD